MRYFFLLLLLTLPVFAETALDHKQGFTMAIGLNTSIYRFPVQFDGLTKGKMDESATAVGPQLSLGYDLLFWNHLLIGIRTEGMLADTSGLNKDKTSKRYDHTKGKTRAFLALLRLGYVSGFKGTDMVGKDYHMTAEFFLEGGLGSGRNDYTKNYEFEDDNTGVTEFYNETIDETFTSSVIGVGANVTAGGGAFCELKVLYQTIHSHDTERDGSSQVSGGPVVLISGDDSDPEPITSVVLSIGHHY